MTTRIYEYQARPGMTVGIDQAQWMEGGCDVVIDSLHKVDDFHVPPSERRRMAEALYPEHNRGRLVELEAALVEARAVDAGLRAQLAAAEKRTEAYRAEIRRLTDKIAASQEPPAPAPKNPDPETRARIDAMVDAVQAEIEAEAAPKGGTPRENEAQEMVLAHVSDSDLLRRAREETHDTGEGCHPAIASELGRRGLVEWSSDDENEEDTGKLTSKGRAALATPEPPAAPPPHETSIGWLRQYLEGLVTADTWASTALGHLADVERALRPAPAAPTEPDDPPCAKCGQPVTDECFAVQSYETGAWTHDPCPPVCTPSTYPTGAMERMSRRGDIEAGAAITPAAAAPLGAGPERYVTGAELERVHDAAEVLRDAASSYAEAVSTSDPLSSEDGRWLAAADKRLLSAARAWVALLPAAPNAPQAEPLAYPEGYQGPSTPGEHAAYRDGLRHGAEHERQPWLLWCGEILMSVCEREDGYPDVSPGQVRDFVLANLRMRKAASAPQGPSAAVLSELAAEFYSAGDEWAGVRLETVAGLTSDPASAPRAEPPRTIDPSTGHYGDPVVMECGGEPGCGQTEHHVCFMCSKCDAHRYPNTSPRSHWMASAPQGGPPRHKLEAAAHIQGARAALREVKRGRAVEEVEQLYAIGPEDFRGEDYPAMLPDDTARSSMTQVSPEGIDAALADTSDDDTIIEARGARYRYGYPEPSLSSDPATDDFHVIHEPVEVET